MASDTLIDQIRPGMVVRSADGKRLGKLTQVHTRTTEIYLQVTPGANLWKPWQLMIEVKCLYLPGSTVTSVAAKDVQIAMDARTAKGCTWRPDWIAREKAPRYGGGGVGMT